jgi:hypothetical protein
MKSKFKIGDKVRTTKGDHAKPRNKVRSNDSQQNKEDK